MYVIKSLPALAMLKNLSRYSAYAMVLSVCVGISASTASPTTGNLNQNLSSWQQIEAQGSNQYVYFYVLLVFSILNCFKWM